METIAPACILASKMKMTNITPSTMSYSLLIEPLTPSGPDGWALDILGIMQMLTPKYLAKL